MLMTGVPAALRGEGPSHNHLGEDVEHVGVMYTSEAIVVVQREAAVWGRWRGYIKKQ